MSLAESEKEHSMARHQRREGPEHEVELLVAILRFASVISRPMRDGVADPAGFSSNTFDSQLTTFPP